MGSLSKCAKCCRAQFTWTQRKWLPVYRDRYIWSLYSLWSHVKAFKPECPTWFHMYRQTCMKNLSGKAWSVWRIMRLKTRIEIRSWRSELKHLGKVIKPFVVHSKKLPVIDLIEDAPYDFEFVLFLRKSLSSSRHYCLNKASCKDLFWELLSC